MAISLDKLDPAMMRMAQQLTLSSAESVEIVQANLVDSMRGANAGILNVDVSMLDAASEPVDEDPSRPSLSPPSRAAPSDPAERLSRRAALTLMLAQVQDASIEGRQQQLENGMASWNALSQARQAQLEGLSEEFKQAVDDLDQANQQLGQATEDYQQAKSEFEAANQALAEAEAQLSVAQEALDALDPTSPGYADAQAAVVAAQFALDAAQARRTLTEQVMLAANNRITLAATAANNALARANAALAQMPADMLEEKEIAANKEKKLNNAAALTYLLAMITELMGKNAQESLRTELDRNQKISKASQDQALQKAQEEEDQANKQAAMNQGVNCGMRILGALVTVVSLISAAVTGGASLVVAGVMVGLMAANKATEAATGTSLAARVMNPLMEHLFKPLVKALTGVISDLLQSFGMDKAKAEMVGTILATILGSVALIAAMIGATVLAKNAITKMGPALTRLVGDAVSKLAPQVLKDLSSKAGTQFAQMGAKASAQFARASERMSAELGRISEKVLSSSSRARLSQAGTDVDLALKRVKNSLGDPQTLGNRIDKGVTAMRVVEGSALAAQGVFNGVFELQKGELMFDITQLQVLQDMLSRAIDDATERYANLLAIVSSMLDSAFEIMPAETAAKQSILNNIGALARAV